MQIRRLEIENFRGIEAHAWHPRAAVNVILGAGDSGKSTLLDAIALTLSPQPSQAASETDYRHMDTSQPFRIKVVLGRLSEEFRARIYPAPLWGWNAESGNLTSAPNEESGLEPVAHVELEGTTDLELQHRLLQPGNEPRPLSVPARVAAGLWNVNTNRSPDSQLRMSRGSLLERTLGRDLMRAPAAAAMQGSADSLRIPPDAAKVLERLGNQLREAGVSIDELALTLVPGIGQSPVQLVTLVAKSTKGHIPLASYGRGSQQVTMVTLAAAEVGEAPIAVIDELEAGLEPYRQRALLSRVRELVAEGGQAFITSHSPAIVGRLVKGEAWRLRFVGSHSIQAIDGELDRLMHKDPEGLLCRLPVVCEGATEVGVLSAMFERPSGVDASAFGVYVIDAGGHTHALDILEAFSRDETVTFGLVDNERFASGKRTELGGSEYVRLYMPPGGRCIECAVANAIPTDAIETLVELPGAAAGHFKLNDRLQAISTRLGKQSRQSINDLILEFGEPRVREAVGETAVSGEWFKSIEGGRALGEFIGTKVPSTHPLAVALNDLVRKASAYVGLVHVGD